MKAFLTIVLKEIRLFLRSTGLVAAVLFFFLVDVYIVGNDIEIEPKNVKIGYVDYSDSPLANRILSKLHEPEFKPPIMFKSQKELTRAIYEKKIVAGIIFEADFERRYTRGLNTKIDLLLDSTAATQSLLTLNYLQKIILSLSERTPPVKLKIHKLFNQNADTKKFMPLAELLSILTLFGVILSASVFVKEKEQGTWDIMLLTPVDSKVIIFAKTSSQVIILFLLTMISTGIDLFGIFDLPLNGSFLAYMGLTILFLYSIAGIGLFVAAVSNTIMEVAQWSVFLMMPIIFLSGAWTPIYSMNEYLQYLSYLSPLRYYIEGVESVLFRGTATADLWLYFAGMGAIGAILFGIGYKKIGRLF